MTRGEEEKKNNTILVVFLCFARLTRLLSPSPPRAAAVRVNPLKGDTKLQREPKTGNAEDSWTRDMLIRL